MPRIWATLGNLYRIEAFFGALGLIALTYSAIQRFQVVGADSVVLQYAAVIVVGLVICSLLWMIKPVLISNRPRIIGPIVRILIGGSFLLGWLVLAALLATYYQYRGVVEAVLLAAFANFVYFGIVYAFTGEPAAYEYARAAPQQQAPRYKAPANFAASNRVGPSGAMLYSDAMRTELIGQFESYVPIQVLEQSGGFSRVTAATGQSGWVDSRTVGAL